MIGVQKEVIPPKYVINHAGLAASSVALFWGVPYDQYILSPHK